MALFGNTERAKQRSLSKILGYTRDDDKKTLDQLENEFQTKIGALPTDYKPKDAREIAQTPSPAPQMQEGDLNTNNLPNIDEVNTNNLPNIDSVDPNNVPMVMATPDPISFSDMGKIELDDQQMLRQNIIESIGKQPELNESQLKRARTQALVNAFGNLLQAGVGFGTMQSGGFFQAQPIDNSQVLANLEGVYDDYYKELADYRDNKSRTMLQLAQLDANQLQQEQQRALDQEKEEVRKKEIKDEQEFRKELAQMDIDARSKIQNARTADERRQFINDGMDNLNERYENSLEELEQINENIEKAQLAGDDAELAQLIKQRNEKQQQLNSISNMFNTFAGYADQIIRTGTISFDDQEVDTNTPATDNPQIVDQQNANLTLQSAIDKAKVKVKELLTDLGYTSSNLPSLDRSSVESLESFLEILNNAKTQKDNIDLFNAKDLYDSRGKYKKIAELKSQITSLIDALKRQQNQS